MFLKFKILSIDFEKNSWQPQNKYYYGLLHELHYKLCLCQIIGALQIKKIFYSQLYNSSSFASSFQGHIIAEYLF